MILGSIALRILLIVAFAAACFGSGFMLGVEWEGNKRDSEALKVVRDVEIRIKEVEKIVVRVEKKYIVRLIQREAVREQVTQEVDKHVETIPDPRECWLAPDRVSTINRAVGEPGDQRVEAGAVQEAGAAAVGEPQRGGEVGSGHGVEIPRVRGQTFGAGGDSAGSTGGIK